MPADDNHNATSDVDVCVDPESEEKALIARMNRFITAAVESAPEQTPQAKQYLVYFDSPMNGRSLYLVTDDAYVADSARHHIASYFSLMKNVSVMEVDPGEDVDEIPKYMSSDELYRDLWW